MSRLTFYTDPAMLAAVNTRIERESRLRIRAQKHARDPRPLPHRVAREMVRIAEGGEKSVLKPDLILAGFTSAELTDVVLAEATDIAITISVREVA